MREYLANKLEEYTGKKIIVIARTASLEVRNVIVLEEYEINDTDRLLLRSEDYELYFNFGTIDHAEEERLKGLILMAENKPFTTAEIYFLDN